VILSACSGGSGATTTIDPGGFSTSVTIAPISATTTTTTLPASPLPGFGVSYVGVTGQRWLVAVADTPGLRARGLMGVVDLGVLDGMLFVWESDASSGFWMKDTLIPLDIAFFDEAGVLVDQFGMVPCADEPCEVYQPSGRYRYALEARPGAFEAMDQPSLVLSGE
jgi:uncharacterized membrane protein (UPF0127 family)